ncbi:MAG: hypothetical protein KGN79_11720 [Acidobacteriota bacterium]|nr:hypothetical protein [Acidobacteriota bacterium]
MHPAEANIAENEIVLHPRKRKVALYSLLCLAFTMAGAWQIARREDLIVGWLGVLFFGLCFAVFVLQLLPGAAYLRLNSDGFRFCSLFRRSSLILWQDVSDFRVVPIPPSGHRMVVFDRQGAPSRKVRRINRHLVGASDGLPDSYGLKPEELAALLNEWRSRSQLSR